MAIRPILTTLAVFGLTGCASLQPRQAFPEVAAQVEQRTGARTVWNQGTDSDQAVEQSLREMLSHQLTADAAVQIALLNNRTVQATYEELGIAQAELVQAGLLKNPVFSALVRFPDGGTGSGADVELSVSQNFLELLSAPLRKNVAAAQYEASKVRVASEVVALAADVKDAFYTLQGAEQMLEMRRSVVEATGASLEAAKRLRDAGNTSDLDLANEQSLHGQAKLDLARAETEAIKDREHLLLLLGLWGPSAEIKLANRLPDLPARDEALDNIEALAIRQRLDLAAATKDLNATYQSLGLTRRFTWLNDAELSVDGERSTDGSWVTGPGISIPIPIFDTGAAQVSVASSRVRQATLRVYALAVQIRSEARTARAELIAARARADYYRTSVIPLRQKITEQTQLQFNGMLTGVFQLLQAKREEIEAGRDYIESLRDYWLARTALERAVGGRWPGDSAAATAPDMPQDHSVPTNKAGNEHQH